ncbi:hypothetical protein [Mobilicoccus caccae]|nr:hypothetical protein [Mobilicoccus caccae]
MFAGTGNPIPTKGFNRISWLKGPFTQITDRLTHHLRHTPELLADPDYARVNTTLTLHLAAYSMAEIGNRDPIGRRIAAGMPDGDIQLAVRDDAALILRARGGRLSVHEGVSPTRRATMVFADLDSAGAVLRGEVATYTALGRGDIEPSGYVPLLDKMNKLLGLVPRYLA